MSAPPPTTLPAGPLSGIIVADFSHVLAAPYATMLVGDLGADVIKAERPGTGDDTGTWGPPFAGDQATYFLSANRNKRPLVADLSDPAARADLPELVRRAESWWRTSGPARCTSTASGGRTCRRSTRGWCPARSPASARGRAPRCPGTTCSCTPWAA
jgi:crotonobetainyl-CoA:carnitine CoA-transferase CaiB-like acyl-CoA transferase